MAHKPEVFSSRWGLVLAALGMAVGTGNIWRFPRVAAEQGGGAFLIPWILALFLWSIPLLMVELAIGKKTRRGTIGAFASLLGRHFAWMGGFVGFCTMAIMFYYSVVTGWCFRYFFFAVQGKLGTDTERFWNGFAGSGSWEPVFFHALALSVGLLIINRGVVRGIERANRVLIPSLFVLLIVAAGRAVTLENAGLGLEFLFSPDLTRLGDYRVWLAALTQSAWSTGAGWGLILTYACYMRRHEDIALNSMIAGLGNNSASLLAAMAVVPTVFAFLSVDEAMAVMGSGNNGLSFIWIPRLFQQVPAGGFFAAVFFLALSVAALSSLIAMLELAVRLFMDTGMGRGQSLIFVGCMAFLLGIPSALWMPFFENQDWVWGVGLMVSGVFIAYAALHYGVDRFRRECVNMPGSDLKVGRWFNWVVSVIIPVEFLAMLSWWFFLSATSFDREGWWNPFRVSSVGTCVAQWGVILALLGLFNTRLARWSQR